MRTSRFVPAHGGAVKVFHSRPRTRLDGLRGRFLPRVVALSGLFFFGLGCATAADSGAQSPSVYLQGGAASHGTRALTLGATLPWGDWQKPLGSGVLTGHWDGYVSRWTYDGVHHGGLVLLGLTPVLRWTPDGGRSPWFFQGGIGVTLMNHLYRTPGEEFSTAFNFASHLGVGLRFGEHRQQEMMLRVQHISNAGIKHPNPGINYLQLRYGLHW